MSGSASGAQDPLAALRSALEHVVVHDASPAIEPGMPMFPAFPGPGISPLTRHEDIGVASNLLTLAEHTGSHLDAPFHFDPDGDTIDVVPADALFLRPYKKFDLSGLDPQPGELIGSTSLREAAHASGFGLAPGDVAILEMGWDRYWPAEAGDHTRSFWGMNMPGLDADACEYLADAGVVAVASDTAACDNAVREGDIGEALGHRHWFLPRGILILEGLRGLASVPATGLVVALPLKIARGTASPVRVLLLHS